MLVGIKYSVIILQQVDKVNKDITRDILLQWESWRDQTFFSQVTVSYFFLIKLSNVFVTNV